MRITDVETFPVHPAAGKPLAFVRVSTDTGLHGWGEAYTQIDRVGAVVSLIDAIGAHLDGWDPFRIRHFTYTAYTDVLAKRGSMEAFSAISALELALWDIVGKATDQPVHNLLGGRCRDRIRVYANGWYDGLTDPVALAEGAVEVVAQGYTALKWDPFPGPWRELPGREAEQAAIEGVATMRAAVGPDVDLLIEVHRRLAPMSAIRVGRAIAGDDPFWFEEPVPGRNLAAVAEVRERTGLPVVVGEELYSKAEFCDVFTHRAADIINPDVCNVGGLLELKEIAAMAEPHGVAVAPHNYNSTTVGLAATVAGSAVMPNFLITEHFVGFEELGRTIAPQRLDVHDGHVELSTAPGLGTDLDPQALRDLATPPTSAARQTFHPPIDAPAT